MGEYDNYPIFIDKRWSLEDLYKFPRAYEQVYFAYEALLPALTDQANDRILRAFNAYPWQGGYSAINFYNQLKYATPINKRPVIKRMQYASPGVIDLFLNLPLALQIAGVVTSVAGSIGACNKVYHAIYTNAQKRKLLGLDIKSREIEVANKQIDFILEANQKLAGILQLESPAVIESRVEHPLIAMKIMMSIYRRVKTLVDYQEKGKAKLPQHPVSDKGNGLIDL